jgi:hypothetical protein
MVELLALFKRHFDLADFIAFGLALNLHGQINVFSKHEPQIYVVVGRFGAKGGLALQLQIQLRTSHHSVGRPPLLQLFPAYSMMSGNFPILSEFRLFLLFFSYAVSHVSAKCSNLSAGQLSGYLVL